MVSQILIVLFISVCRRKRMALLSCYFYQIASSSNLLQPSGRDLDFDTFFIQFTAGITFYVLRDWIYQRWMKLYEYIAGKQNVIAIILTIIMVRKSIFLRHFSKTINQEIFIFITQWDCLRQEFTRTYLGINRLSFVFLRHRILERSPSAFKIMRCSRVSTIAG